ncbi:PSP1-domain-containing protein [Schizophyllum commune Tattone D]|uniref:PSP1 C-terminal domain-containing protein n=1 Tax=Schizophyllum commune (strain H4-8 / FGSC 9210) TaxID=578458 RepID=D8QKD0_SCHCM|nr:PSP1-domain-containing protein [Schizophyllum commune H4-8]KAI4526779.1 PSP1-domain-containing protein [Schizophyllum commune Loenen D]KAI5830223.1 PSP1-domain-containing protein [Schizophyllum commune Tattone D]KAI5885057.1 PSP1-domain-containing protein [Schizophyllum commune H4-8]
MSPFVRDVGQILLDDGSAFRELWAGMHPPRDEVNGGGGSGTTSRRHSVSVVQPRRGNIVGFNAPGVSDGPDDVPRSFAGGGGFGGGLMLSDDDLAADLGMLDLNGPPKASQQPPSQPASMPVYTPISRSPPSQDHYQPMNIGSLSSHNGDLHRDPSPPQHQEQAHDLQPRFIPGQGIQYLSQQAIQQDQNAQYARTRRPSYTGGPLSPTSQRMVQNPQSPPYYPTRRPSDAQAPAPPQQLTDLGKGVPLHAVPPSWPLFIVEFKAGRTDLFYLTDTSQDIRVGDLVVVEADRGKDLGKVVNDSITIAEVEAWQTRQQGGANSGAENPTSPGGAPSSSKKEINPKMMYGKASVQDTQQLQQKLQDELKALQLCQTKVRAKKLPMEVIDAEYQWDRRKLTFYFIAEKRIDFRELVRELFRLYKTRIWMASLQGGVSFEQ